MSLPTRAATAATSPPPSWARSSTRRPSSSWCGRASPSTSRSATRSMNKTEIIAIFDLTDAPHGLYDVEVINPDGAVALAPYRYLVEQALPPDVSVALGGPRVVWAGQSGLYGFSLDQPDQRRHPLRRIPVRRSQPAPECPGRQCALPGLDHTTGRCATGIMPCPCPTCPGLVNPVADTTARIWPPATPSISPTSPTRRSVLTSRPIPTAVGGGPGNPPADTAFTFNIVGVGDAADRAEFIAQQNSRPPPCAPTS